MNNTDNFKPQFIEGYRLIYTEKGNLFTSQFIGGNYDVNSIKRSVEHNLNQIIAKNSYDYIINVDTDKLTSYLSQYYIKDNIVLYEDKISQNSDINNVNIYYTNSEKLHSIRNGLIVTFFIPVSGDIQELQNNKYWGRRTPIYGILKDNTIKVQYFIPEDSDNNFHPEEHFKENLSNLKKILDKINSEIDDINSQVIPIIKNCILEKQNKIKPLIEIKNSISYPMVKNGELPETFVVPLKKKTLPILQTQKTINQQENEYTIDIKDYDNIIKICSDMALVMERSPKAFEKIEEEDLRMHFLVQLNGHYEGNATGETFNLGGKTDILIRKNNENIFIAECKYWHGEQKYLETIDQILDYISFRDTKTAILMFVKVVKDFSKIIEKINETSKKHPNFIKEVNDFVAPNKLNESSFRYLFKNNSDKSKTFYLTVMAFYIYNKD